MAKYGHHVRRIPMLASQLIGGLLRKCLRAMLPSSMGLDGWSLQDLRSLPDRTLDYLVRLLVQGSGQVARGLRGGVHLLHPETGGGGPPGHLPAHGCVRGVRCKEVEVTPWYPLAIWDVPISATFGFSHV